MGAGHDHGSVGSGHVGASHRRALTIAFVLLLGFFVVEVIGGLTSGSLTLLSDSGHMLTDVVGIGMALAAISLASAGTKDRQRTFGLYRLEILAALANAVLLFGVAIWVVVEAISRFNDPPEVASTTMLVVATVGLVVNLVAFRLLRPGSRESLNLEGAYIEVMADTLGSVAAVIAGLVMLVSDIRLIDPIVAIAIGLFVLPRTWRLGHSAVKVLVQAAPDHLDMATVATDLGAIEGVTNVHDLHVWTLTSGMDVCTVHLATEHAGRGHAILDKAQQVLRDTHGIGHATVQVDPPEHEQCADCEALTW